MPSSDFDAQFLRRILEATGAHLEAGGASASLVVVGGAALSLRGWVNRSTHDVDVIATTVVGDTGHWRRPEFPAALVTAARRVARDFNLADDWLNIVVGAQWDTGLPAGIESDTLWMRFGGLHIGAVGRATLIALKLFAAVDSSPSSVHTKDLIELAPSDAELERAAEWVLGQDASDAFPALLQQVIEHVREHR